MSSPFLFTSHVGRAEGCDVDNGLVARAVVSHYSYGPQREGLGLTDIMDKYRALAVEATGIMFQ